MTIAQELATANPDPYCSDITAREVSAELLRIEKINAELLDALKGLLNYENLGAYDRANVRNKASTIIAKANGKRK